MHKIDRPAKAPEIFSHPSIIKWQADVKAFYSKLKPGTSLQQRPPDKPLPKNVNAQILIELQRLFNGCCAYCEMPVMEDSYHGFDHFRPKFGARGLKKEFSPLHYWWLGYHWENMYLCCADCNKRKSNWFPVKGKRSNNKVFAALRKEERNLLMDPCGTSLTHPQFMFDTTGAIHPIYIGDSGLKARTTIEILDLNRPAILSARKLAIAPFTALCRRFEGMWHAEELDNIAKAEILINQLLAYIDDLYNPGSNMTFPTIQRAFVAGWINNNLTGFDKEIHNFFIEDVKPRTMNPEFFKVLESKPGKSLRALIKKLFGQEERRVWIKDVENVRNYAPAQTERIYIDKIVVKNFKAISELVIDFPVSGDKQESWLMLLGENSVGKSSFLQAVALTLAGNSYLAKLDKAAHILPADLLRHGEAKGSVEIYASTTQHLKKTAHTKSIAGLGDPIVLDIDKDAACIVSNLLKPGTFVFGYGSTRLFPTKKLRPERSLGKIRMVNLFDPGTALLDAKKWLLSLKSKKTFDQVCIALKDLLLLKNEDMIVKERGEIYIHYGGGSNVKANNIHKIKLGELSDGYKSVIAVAVDMMQTLIKNNMPIEAAEGIVLLDEIGTHLHPRWRMEVVRLFRKTFPRLQFLVTTHDPLCLRGLKKGEVVVLKRDAENNVFAMTGLPDPSEFRVDQLLSSEFFGLSSTIDPEMELDFNRYYDLLRRKDRLNKRETAALTNLQKKLNGKRHLGNSLREELAFEAVDEILSKQDVAKEAPRRDELKASTVSMVEEMWNRALKNKKP